MRVVPITWTPSKEVLAIPSMSFSLTVFAVDVRTGSKSIQNRLPGGGGGRRTDAGFPLVLSVSSGLFQVGTPASGESKRTFEVADGSELTITELPGDSIEGHIWYLIIFSLFNFFFFECWTKSLAKAKIGTLDMLQWDFLTICSQPASGFKLDVNMFRPINHVVWNLHLSSS